MVNKRTISFFFLFIYLSSFLCKVTESGESARYCYLVGSSSKLAQSIRLGVVTPCFLAFPALLGYDRSRVDLPSLVITMLIFSTEILGCPEIFQNHM
jgi:hypothetical protein